MWLTRAYPYRGKVGVDQPFTNFGDQNPIPNPLGVYNIYSSDASGTVVNPPLLRITNGLIQATSGNASRHFYLNNFSMNQAAGFQMGLDVVFATGGATLFTFIDVNCFVPTLSGNKTAKFNARISFAANAYTIQWLEGGVVQQTSGAVVGGTFVSASGILKLVMTPGGDYIVSFNASGTWLNPGSLPFSISNSISGTRSALTPGNVRIGFSGNAASNTSIGFRRYWYTQQ